MRLVVWILLGLVAGWLAGQFMRGGGYGLLGDTIFLANPDQPRDALGRRDQASVETRSELPR